MFPFSFQAGANFLLICSLPFLNHFVFLIITVYCWQQQRWIFTLRICFLTILKLTFDYPKEENIELNILSHIPTIFINLFRFALNAEKMALSILKIISWFHHGFISSISQLTHSRHQYRGLPGTAVYPQVSTANRNTQACYYTSMRLYPISLKNRALRAGRQAVSSVNISPALSVTLQTGKPDISGSEDVQWKLLILLGSMPISPPLCLTVNLCPLTKSKKAEMWDLRHTDIGRVSSEWMNHSCIATANLSAMSQDAWLTLPDWSI